MHRRNTHSPYPIGDDRANARRKYATTIIIMHWGELF